MANIYLISLLVFEICISSSLNFAYGKAMEPKLKVLGHVYCDTCRVGQETKLSQPIEGAIMMMQCKNSTSGSITYQSKEVLTDMKGNYAIDVEGDCSESNCEVTLVKNPKADCHDPAEELQKASIVHKEAAEIKGDDLYAKDIGIKKKDALPECTQLPNDMGHSQPRKQLGEKPPCPPKDNHNTVTP